MKNTNFKTGFESQDINEVEEIKSDFQFRDRKEVKSEVKNFFKSFSQQNTEGGKSDSHDKVHDKDGVIDAEDSEKALNMPDADKELKTKTTLSDKPAVTKHSYTMNTPKTIEYMRNQMSNKGKEYFDSQIEAGGGVNGQCAHLHGVGKEYFMTSSSDKKASGNFLTEENPGATSCERKENLQLPPGNDASVVDRVVSKKTAIVLSSDVAPQEEWAKESGYQAKKGIKQVFTPNLDPKGAIHAGIYEIEQQDNINK